MGRPHRKVFARTETGCLTCRERRKKYDEIEPSCTGCSRNFISCRWPIAQHMQHVPTWLAPVHTSRSSSPCEEEGESTTIVPASPSSGSGSSESPNGVCSIGPTLPPEYIRPTDIVNVLLEKNDEEEEPQAVQRWLPAPSSFKGAEQAIALTPSSLLLLQHYLEATLMFLVAKPLINNPFITVILPLALSDDLLMHSVLALSGT